MCLVALALDQSSRFPFVMAANRDEFFDRPAAHLDWWEPDAGGPAILGGRDLHAGGTWLGLTASGRLGVITNIRDPRDLDPQAPSRGSIVPQWLKGDLGMPMLWPRLAMSGHNGFNLIALDFSQGDCFWVNNRRLHPERLTKGIFGLSNAQLNTPWPKVQNLKGRLRSALTQAQDTQELAQELFAALADDTRAPDAQLPRTGVSLEWERLLSSAFIHDERGLYGTRCSTVIVTERVNKRLVTHVMEKVFSPQMEPSPMRSVRLRNWPPRHTMTSSDVARLEATLPPPALRQPDEAVEIGAIAEGSDLGDAANAGGKRQRARSLIKPACALGVKA